MTIILTVIAVLTIALIAWAAPGVIRRHRRDVSLRNFGRDWANAFATFAATVQRVSEQMVEMSKSWEAMAHLVVEPLPSIKTYWVELDPEGTP